MKITVLVEDTVRTDIRGLRSEHGLSLLIEHAGKRILFDVGQSNQFLSNADMLGVSLEAIDALILSHGHYDHTGGLPFAIKRWGGKGVKLIAHPDVFKRKVRKNGEEIGSPITKDEAAAAFDLVLSSDVFSVSDSIHFTGVVPRKFEDPGTICYHYKGDARVPDPVHDDGSIILDTEKGSVVVTGCAHAGIVNVARFAERFRNQAVYALVGGFHLVDATDDRLAHVIEAFKQMKIKELFPGHCTGLPAVCRMRCELGARKIDAGTVIKL